MENTLFRRNILLLFTNAVPNSRQILSRKGTEDIHSESIGCHESARASHSAIDQVLCAALLADPCGRAIRGGGRLFGRLRQTRFEESRQKPGISAHLRERQSDAFHSFDGARHGSVDQTTGACKCDRAGICMKCKLSRKPPSSEREKCRLFSIEVFLE